MSIRVLTGFYHSFIILFLIKKINKLLTSNNKVTNHFTSLVISGLNGVKCKARV